MPCLYCGKEIGAIQAWRDRDNEFCSPAHRQLYAERLTKAIGRVVSADPAPTAMAGPCPQFLVEEGNRQPLLRPWQIAGGFPPPTYQRWPLSIAVRRESFLTAPDCPPQDYPGRFTAAARPAISLKLPGFALDAAAGPLASPAETPVNVVQFARQQPRSELGFAAGRRKPATAVTSVIPPAMAAAGPADWPTPAPTPALPKAADPAPQTARTPGAVPPVREPVPAVAGPANAAPAPASMAAPPRSHTAAAPMTPAPTAPDRLPMVCDASMVEGGHAECIPAVAPPAPVAPSEQPALAAASVGSLMPPASPGIALYTTVPAGEMMAVGLNPVTAPDAPRMSGERNAAAAASSDPLLPKLAIEGTGPAELDRLSAPILNPKPHERFMPAAACEPAARWLTASAADRDIAPEIRATVLPALVLQLAGKRDAELAEASWIYPVAALAAAADRPLWCGSAMAPVEQGMRVPTAIPAGATEATPPQADLATCQPMLEIGLPKIADHSAPIPGGVPSLRVPALPDPERILPKGSAPSPAALPVESSPAPNSGPKPLYAPPLRPQTQVAAAQTATLRPAPFRAPEARPAFPPPMYWNPNVAVLEPIPPQVFQPEAMQSEPSAAAIPAGGFIELDFYLQRGSGRPAERAEWITPIVTLCWPALTIKKINEREAPAPVAHKEPPKEKKKLKIPEIPKRNPRTAVYIGRIAACLVAGFSLWLGAHLLRLSTAPSDGELAEATQSERGKGDVATAAPATSTQSWLSRAIRGRAAVSVGDTFQSGMKAWGAGQTSWASGWTHSTEGYVRPGALALFQPAMNYTDYRLEFNGQIESKGMNWVVRAKDTGNYYGMKLSVVEPGLRPILSIAHYTVVDGRKGRKTELPLVSVMVHRSSPIQVAVDVKGKRITTSIDGEEVDSWTDNTLAKGGVGFFSEAGERARLYWMKVSKNQDWLGSICAYLSGGSGQTAEVWGPAVPGIPQPAAPPRREDVAVVPESLQYRRYGRWNS